MTLVFACLKKRIPNLLGPLNMFNVSAIYEFHWGFQKGNNGLHL